LSTCQANGTCVTLGSPPFASVCNPGAAINEGATCTNGSPCNAGFCSSGNCVRRSPTQISGVVEDYNACTDPNSTTCNGAGLVVGTTCVTDPNATCPPCNSACGTDPTTTSNGDPVPCRCISTQ
jgi:hypothetical protein